MTINELLIQAGNIQNWIIIYLAAVPLIALVCTMLHKPAARISTAFKYIYAVLIYATAIPGAIGFSLTVYTLFFIKLNLLNVNFTIYFLPLISMIISIILISKKVDLREIPGFNRIIGLFVLLVITMFCALLLLKVRIFIGIFASPVFLIAVIVGIFILFKWSVSKLTG